VLAGSRGLLPMAPFLEQARARGLGFAEIPTIFWWASSDRALALFAWIGAALSLLALFGVATRACLALSTLLYLSYATAGRTFFSFQWDNLLLEAGLIATILPRDREAKWAHTLARVLLFKLYFESGLAKWQSPIGDWQDGSAMTFYYETAPLPTRLAWYAHHLPTAWHHFESIFTLFFELALPFAIFGPRLFRRPAFFTFTSFQLLNIATANYGFFSHLALALHVMLLDDRDLLVFRARIRRASPKLSRAFVRLRLLRIRMRRWSLGKRSFTLPRWARLSFAIAFSTAYLGISLVEGLIRFARPENLSEAIAPLEKWWAPLRLVNNYHLFAQITRTRVEPEVEWSDDGTTFHALDFRYKPGDPARPPPFVAPHQPRVDFQLWFYGLSARRGAPPWVTTLLERLCKDPAAVAPLFASPPPEAPRFVRIGLHDYHFTSPEERAATGAYWKRSSLGVTSSLACAR